MPSGLRLACGGGHSAGGVPAAAAAADTAAVALDPSRLALLDALGSARQALVEANGAAQALGAGIHFSLELKTRELEVPAAGSSGSALHDLDAAIT